MPDNKFVPPSDAVEVKSSSSFVPPSDAVEVKKKVATELPSGQKVESSSLATQKTVEQKPSVSSGSEDNIFSGYPGKEAKKYKLQNGLWYEQEDVATHINLGVDNSGKAKSTVSKTKTSWKPIENEGRVSGLNKVFKQDAYYSKQNKTEEELKKKIIAQQKELKGKGYDVDFNGLLDGKTLIAQNKEQAKTIVTEKDKIEKQKVLNSIDAYINSGLIGNEEEQVVSFLRKKFGNQGFIFEESGAGDNLSISYSPDGITTTKAGEISLDNWTTNKDVSEMNKLKTFMRQAYMTTSEKKEISETGNVRKLASLMAKNPEKYGNELVSKDWFDSHVNKSYNTLTLEQKRLNTDYKSLDAQIIKYNENPTPEGLKAIQNKQSELDVRKYAIVKEYGELDKATKDYSKAVGVYAKDKASKGNFIGIVSAGLAQGITNVEKMGATIAADVIPYIVDEPVDPVTKQEFKASGYTDAQIKDYAAKELKQRILPKIKEGIQNVATLGTTTSEYVQSSDRNDLEKTANFLSESIGTALSGGGNPLLQKIAFFSQSYNAMEDQMMKGQDFEGLSETEKKLVSVPYGIAIGALEKLGFDISAGANATVNNMISKVIARTFTQLPKDASIELIERTIIENVKLNITRGVAKVGASVVSEGIVEGMQNLAETGEKFLVNKIEGFDYFKDVPDITTKEGAMKALDAAKTDAYYGALGGAIMSGVSQSKDYVVNGFNEKLKDDDFYAWVESVSDENLVRASKLNIKDKFRKGEITKDEAKEQLKGIDEAISIVNQIPAEYKVRDKRDSFNLINEKAKLEKSIEGKDKALVTAQTDRINAINEELKAISINNSKTEQDAVKESTEQQQEIPTEGSTVEYQGANEGQQEVRQGEGSERTTTQPEANISDSDIASEEEIIIPTEELDILKGEIDKKKDEGSLSINLGEKAFMGDIPGTIKIDPSNENTIVFETNEKIFELGNAENIGESDIASFGLSLFPSTGTLVTDTENAITYDNKKYKVLGRRRDKKGKAVVRLKDLDSGLERRIVGADAENILKDYSLSKKKVEEKINLTTEGKPEIQKKKEKKSIDNPVNVDSTLEEIKNEEERLKVEATNFENELLKDISSESKKESNLIFKIKDSEYSVTLKGDGSFSVSQKNSNGKFVGIKDLDKRKSAIDEYNKIKESKDTQRLKQAEELSSMFKKEQDDKIMKLLDKAIQATSSKGRAFDATLGIPMFVANSSLKLIKASYKAGKSLSEAIKDGYDFIAKNGYKVSDYDYKKFVYENINAPQDEDTNIKQKKDVTPPSAKKILGIKKTKVTVDEYTALRDQLRLEAKAARESKADLKAKQADLIARFNAMKVKGKMNTNTVTAIINRIKNLNLDNQAKVDAFLDYAANVFKNVNYDTELSKGLKLKGSISKSLKGKSNPFAKLAREFSKLNVRWVENIEQYNEIAQKVHDSVRNSKFKQDADGNIILDLKQEADIQEIYDYFIKEKDSQSQRLEDNYKKLYEETTGKSADGKTMAELKSEMALAKIDYTDEKRQAIEDKLDEFKDLAKSTPDVSDKVKEALNVDLDVLDIKEAVALLDALDTYFANGTTAKMSNIMGNYRGKYNAKNSKLRASKLRLAGSRKFGKVMNEYLSNLGITAERLFRGHTGGEQFQKESGFTSVYNGANRAETETRNKSDEYTKLFNKRKGFDTIENIYERNVMAFLDRSPEIQEDADFFAIRKKLLQQSYETLMNGSDAEKVMGEVYKKVFDKLDLDNAKDINDIIKNSSNDNVEAVRYIQQMFSDVHPELSEFALDMHNTMLARDNNYTPDIYKKTFDNKNTPVFDESSFAFGNFANITLNTSEAGVLIESSRPESLSKGMFISLDFENNMFNAHRLALTDMYTAEGIRQFDSYMKSDDIETIIPDSEDRQIMRDSMNGYVNDKKGKTFTEKALISEFKKITNYFGKLGAFRALGSIRQFPIQFASAVTNALVATGFGKNGVYIDLKAPFDKKIKKLMDESGRSIANRGVESAISAMNKETDVMPVLNTSGKVAKVVEYPIDKAAKANAVVLKQVLGNADNYGARTMWWAFYKKSLADQGLKVDFDKINDKAADYAQSMTDRQAEVSDVSLRGKVFKSKNPTTAFIKDVLMPFAGFSLNQKNRLYSDFRNMAVGQTQEDRIFAARSFFATAAEVAVTAKIRLFVAEMMVSAAAGLLGLDDDDEEVKEMYDKLEKENKQNTYSRIIQDIASPNPVFDKFTLRQANKLLDMTGYSDPDMKDFDKMIEDINAKKAYRGEELLTNEEIAEKKEDYILDNKFNFYTSDDADWGYYGILPKKIEETQEIISVYSTGKFQKEFGGKMVDYYLTESDRKKLKNVVGLKLAANILPAESDMISNKALKIIKEKGMSESKFKTYEQINKEIKVTPFVEMLIRETTMSNEKIISYSKYAESDGQLTEKQIKEYNNLKTIYGTKAIGFIEELKSGKTAKQIMGK